MEGTASANPWQEPPHPLLESLFEYFMALENGTSLLRTCSHVCSHWRRAAIDVILGDTGSSRPERWRQLPLPKLNANASVMQADSAGRASTQAAMLGAAAQEENSVGHEAISMERGEHVHPRSHPRTRRRRPKHRRGNPGRLDDAEVHPRHHNGAGPSNPIHTDINVPEYSAQDGAGSAPMDESDRAGNPALHAAKESDVSTHARLPRRRGGNINTSRKRQRMNTAKDNAGEIDQEPEQGSPFSKWQRDQQPPPPYIVNGNLPSLAGAGGSRLPRRSPRNIIYMYPTDPEVLEGPGSSRMPRQVANNSTGKAAAAADGRQTPRARVENTKFDGGNMFPQSVSPGAARSRPNGEDRSRPEVLAIGGGEVSGGSPAEEIGQGLRGLLWGLINKFCGRL